MFVLLTFSPHFQRARGKKVWWTKIWARLPRNPAWFLRTSNVVHFRLFLRWFKVVINNVLTKYLSDLITVIAVSLSHWVSHTVAVVRSLYRTDWFLRPDDILVLSGPGTSSLLLTILHLLQTLSSQYQCNWGEIISFHSTTVLGTCR